MHLDKGDAVRYKTLGAGRVVRQVDREFAGSNRIFAVIYFPHRNLEVQVPIGDPKVSAKLSPVLSETKLKKLLKNLALLSRALPRSWDQREENANSILKNGEPEDWAELLASYAVAEGAGVSIATSDLDIVRTAKELLAAEFASASEKDFPEAIEFIEANYDKAKQEGQKNNATNFAAISKMQKA